MNIEIVKYFSILFFLSELGLMITKHSKKKGIKTKNEKKSLVLIWITIGLSLTIGFNTANYQEWNKLNNVIALLGLSTFIVGIIIRWISIIQLAKEFTVNVAILSNHKLKTDGMYKHIRHPSYSGLLLICFGISIALNSIISIFVIIIPISLALLYRIKIEENILINEFGEVYKNYIIKTHKIIPKIF
jgi:protein-S-isoprenylcysteine O-methyltransferase Ste14